MRGFTLIETVIYLVLLSFLMTSTLITVYTLTQGSSALSEKNTAGEEGNFILRKLDWILSDAKSITVPINWGSRLLVVRSDDTTVDVRLSAGVLEMRENNANYVKISTENVAVTALHFHLLPVTAYTSAGLEASTTLDGLTFSLSYYLKK
jgi:hypothetical protein